jgi:hypothetical protein
MARARERAGNPHPKRVAGRGEFTDANPRRARRVGAEGGTHDTRASQHESNRNEASPRGPSQYSQGGLNSLQKGRLRRNREVWSPWNPGPGLRTLLRHPVSVRPRAVGLAIFAAPVAPGTRGGAFSRSLGAGSPALPASGSGGGSLGEKLPHGPARRRWNVSVERDPAVTLGERFGSADVMSGARERRWSEAAWQTHHTWKLR